MYSSFVNISSQSRLLNYQAIINNTECDNNLLSKKKTKKPCFPIEAIARICIPLSNI